MKIILLAFKDLLLPAQTFLNPQNEIVAWVSEDRGFALEHGIPAEKFCYYWNLDELLHRVEFDCLVFACFQDASRIFEDLLKIFEKAKISPQKILDIRQLFSPAGYILNATFKHLESNPQKYKILASGSSVLMHGISAKYFDLPLINLSGNAQDLYYNLKIVQKAIEIRETNFQYALIGLIPSKFQEDLSRGINNSFYNLRCILALKDTHHFPFDWDALNQIFHPQFFSEYVESVTKQIESRLDMNDPSGEHMNRTTTPLDAVGIRKKFTIWDHKNYPATVEENVRIFDDLLSLCEKHSIFPIVTLPPMMEDYKRRFTRRILDEFNSIMDSFLNRRRFMYVNGWKIRGFDERDFWDPQHLNIQGSAKFSQILNRIIMDLESKNGS